MANPGGSVGADGLTEFDPALMRANGFDNGIQVLSSLAFPLKLQCNSDSSPTYDASPGVDEYDWFVSQKTSTVDSKPFTVSRFDDLPANTYSGIILLQLRTWASLEYTDPFDLSVIQVLWFGVDIYAIRRSDGAIQRFDMLKYLTNELSPKTDLEP